MGRDRSEGTRRAAKAARRDAARDARVEELRREARGWYIRALLAGLAAAGLSLLTVLLAAALGLVAAWCAVEGTRRAIDATRLAEEA
ncbi:hypothetical protein [Paraconexibacter algicola]|uniref:Uncharacterized protein n=1 Tax=Paraconexibacter algicola TaxID=2133960 RepID=A0A2T4UJ95_9ACTN|nr:hypothetical protein [Paraconexibacter algicola]PTL59308.1 hypothetical protein C7Y72_06410 [Paraconexibacter algicola]